METIKVLTILAGITFLISIVNLYGTYNLYQILGVNFMGTPSGSTATTATSTAATPTPTGAQVSNFNIPSYVPYEGSASAKIDFIVFGDYQCPYCERAFSQTDSQVIQNYVSTGKARYYFLDYAFLGPDSTTLAEGSWCANDQGLYYKYHDYIYSNQGQESSGWGTPDKVKALAANIAGLDTQKFNSCMDSSTYASRVQQDTQLGQNAGITGTPGFLIGNNQIGYVSISGAYPYSSFQQALDSQLAKVS